MEVNPKFARGAVGCDPATDSGATQPVEVLPPYSPGAPRIEIGRVLNHPCTFILLGFAAGIWFAGWINKRN